MERVCNRCVTAMSPITAQAALCGGDVEFVQTIDGAGTPAWGFPRAAFADIPLEQSESYRQEWIALPQVWPRLRRRRVTGV
jgi:hypothetical protein